MKKTKSISLLFYAVSILLMLAALLSFALNRESAVAIIFLCLGSSFLCLGSFFKRKEQESKKEDDEKKD